MESLDDIIKQMKEVDAMSREFNPWWHRVLNYLVGKLPAFKRDIIYIVTDTEVYIGPERRSKISKKFRDLESYIRVAMMPTTVKINLEEVE